MKKLNHKLLLWVEITLKIVGKVESLLCLCKGKTLIRMCKKVKPYLC